MLDILLLGASPKGGGGSMQMVFLLLMIAVMYFFMILPQIKKGKAQRKFWSDIKKGDNIVTTGGIHGKITDIKDNLVIIDVESNAKLKIEKSAISLELTTALNKIQA